MAFRLVQPRMPSVAAFWPALLFVLDRVTTPGAYVFTFDPSADPPVSVPVPEPVITESGGPDRKAFGLGLVAAGAILLVFSRNARRAR